MSGKFLAVSAIVVGTIAVLAASPASAVGGKIAPNLANYDIAKGDDSTVTLRLDEPIICPDGTLVCEVTIDFSSAFPAGITPNPSSITWSMDHWSEARYVNFTVDLNAAQSLGTVLTSSAVAASASEYYSNYHPVFTITIPDPNTSTPTPSPTPTPTEIAESGLANTGSNSGELFGLGALFLAVGSLVRIISAKKSKTH